MNIYRVKLDYGSSQQFGVPQGTYIKSDETDSLLNEIRIHKLNCEAAEEATAGLEQEILNLREKIEGFVQEIKWLKEKVERLDTIKFQRFNNDDCWIYQGDGQDYLESLVCPVVISPETLMEIIKK